MVHFQPFDPVHKRTEATVKGKDGKTFKVTKGAPQVILALSANAGQVKAAASRKRSMNLPRAVFVRWAWRGLRATGQWQFLGVLPLFDPPREDAKATIATALTMGVKIKMVTGDALAIAKETAKKLGMGTNILDANSLGDSKKQEISGGGRVHREGRRFRPGVSRTQISHRGCSAKTRPHRRHDGRRGE